MQQHSSYFTQTSLAVRSGLGLSMGMSLRKVVTVLSILLLLLLSFSSFSASNIAKVSGVRIADRGTETRVVFDLSSPVKHSVFVL